MKKAGSHRATLGLIVLLGVGLSIVWIWLRREPVVTLAESRQVSAAPPPAQESPKIEARGVGSQVRSTKSAPELPPIVDSVTVEKAEVCYGEENLISVHAHTQDKGDDELHYSIAGLTGQAVPLVLFPQDEGVQEKRRVSVFGRNNIVTVVDVPTYRLRDCGKRPLVVVEYRGRANRPDEFEFVARLLGAEKGFTAKSYEWDYGDGSRDTSLESRALHSFRRRTQGAAYSQFLVQVVVTGRQSERYSGRVALQLLNRAYQIKKQRGIVAIEAEYEPRFAEMDQAGVVRQRVRLFHHEGTAVIVDKLLVEKQYLGTASESQLSPIDVEKVLKSRTIPNGEGLTFELTLDSELEPDTAALNYVVAGHVDSFAAQGAFSLLRPPKAPTKEDHQPVYEPTLKARIIEARRLLQKEYVTDEDIWALERQGAFHGAEFQPSRDDQGRLGPPAGAEMPYRNGQQISVVSRPAESSRKDTPVPNYGQGVSSKTPPLDAQQRR